MRSDESCRLEQALASADATLATSQVYADLFRASFRLYRDAMDRTRRVRGSLRETPHDVVSREASEVGPDGWAAQRPNGHAAAGYGRPGLTQRELEVASLVAAGLTNRAIARRLILEEGTVANHVRRIRLKLGLSCRAELAAWAARQELAVPAERQLVGR